MDKLTTAITKSFDEDQLSLESKQLLYPIIVKSVDAAIEEEPKLQNIKQQMIESCILALEKNWNKINMYHEQVIKNGVIPYYYQIIRSAIAGDVYPILRTEQDLIKTVATKDGVEHQVKLRDEKDAGAIFGNDATDIEIEEWSPILESYGITDPDKKKWMTKYCMNDIRSRENEHAKGAKVITPAAEEIGISTKPEIKQQPKLQPTISERPKIYDDFDDESPKVKFQKLIKYIKTAFKKVISWFTKDDKPLKETVKDRYVSYDAFMKEYYRLHAACPKCGGISHSSTLAGYIFNSDKPDEYKDKNKCTCKICGDIHITHDRVEIKNK